MEDKDIINQLPELTPQVIDSIFAAVRQISVVQPQQALQAAVGLEAVGVSQNLALEQQGKVAWIVVWIANQCANPLVVERYLQKARPAFETLGDQAWLAACLWQENALPWTRLDFVQAANQLQQALDTLQGSKLAYLAPMCKRSLVEAYLLVREFELADKYLQECFQEEDNPIVLARCGLLKTNYLRRIGNWQQSLEELAILEARFEQLNAPVDVAKTHYQMGVCYYYSSKEFKKSQEIFHRAIEVFSEHGFDLWIGACLNTLAQVNINLGNLALTEKQLLEAREIFERNHIWGMLADNYNDSGVKALYRGDPNQALQLFSQAENYYRQTGMTFSAGLAVMNQGRAYLQNGYFQESLHYLEKVAHQFGPAEAPALAASTAYCQSQLWTSLNRHEEALKHLEVAASLFEGIAQPSFVAWTYIQRADILIAQGNYLEAVTQLQKVLELNTIPVQVALAYRYLGVASAHFENVEDAVGYALKSVHQFEEMGMGFERAESLLVLSGIQLKQDERAAAQESLSIVLEISRQAMPPIEWQALWGLARLSAAWGEISTAKKYYLEAFDCITSIRLTFWQTAISAAFMAKTAEFVDEAAEFISLHGTPSELLPFVEMSKATAVNRSLSSPDHKSSKNLPPELVTLKQQITYLQNQIRVDFSSDLWQHGKKIYQDLQKELHRLSVEYDQKLAKLERRENGHHLQANISRTFQGAQFRAAANQLYGKDWIALDYYCQQDQLIAVILTPDAVTTKCIALNARVELALDGCNTRSATPKDLRYLGEHLIPLECRQALDKDQVLLISPHGWLHKIPWMGLVVGEREEYLCQAALPVLTPSLQTIVLLHQHAQANPKPTEDNGLLLGISEFGELHPALPQVEPELEEISQLRETAHTILPNQQATWQALLAQVDDAKGLSRFGFFHLATHINHDARTGVLSSVVLADQEVWLDQLDALAPLPPLVTLSACNSTTSFVMAGDEHVGLPVTCLSAGASTVVGSIWKVADEVAASVMVQFYQHYFDNRTPALSLALALRAISQQGYSPMAWGGFICLGLGAKTSR